jgi:hypothetical protein
MADRENGGTGILEKTLTAATSPDASASGTRSVRVIGLTAAFSRARASTSEMMEVNGRTAIPY